MLRRLLPSIGRRIVSSASPGATRTHTPLPQHNRAASSGGALLPYGFGLKDAVAVLPGCPRCFSSAAITYPSSLPPPPGPPRNGRRGFTTMSVSPESPVIGTTRGDGDMADQVKAIDSSVTNFDVGGPVLKRVQLPTEIDWAKYVHVRKFDCSGQELYTGAIPLKPYVDKNPMTEVRRLYGNILGKVDPSGKPVKESDLFVKEKAKKYVKNLLDGMSEFHEAGVCVASLNHTKLVLVAGAKVAKYTDITFVPATLEMKKKNYRWLNMVVKETLFENKPLPPEMDRLCYIMETHPVASEYLMKNYVALVPQVNKSAFYLRLYERLKILIFIDDLRGQELMASLPYKHTWRALMQLNSILNSVFTYGAGYDTAMDPYIFALCFKHCCYHKCDKCCHPHTRIQLYTATMFEDIQESTFPGYVCKLEEELYKLAQLHLAKVDDLL